MQNKLSQGSVCKRVLRFIVAFSMSAFMVALSFSVIMTFLFFGGIPILQKGIPMCALLAREGMLGRLLYTSCGCALVELILLPLAFIGLRYFTPRLIGQFGYVRQLGKKR